MAADRVLLDHGSGGRLSHRLIKEKLLPRFDNPLLNRLDDGAVFESPGGRLAMSTDSYTVTPIFFPGGDIGSLAVHGTVNDLAMCGARPLYLSAALILEEGLAMADLERILDSMREAANQAKVEIVTGDTKVVPKGAADRVFINTAGVGQVPEGVEISGDRARPGDVVLISGHIADHGVTILGQREGLAFSTAIRSDSAPLNELVEAMLATGADIRVLRDPTRGGVATTLNEITEQSRVGMVLDEAALPIREEVRGACEILGLDPLYLANEGKLLAVVPKDEAETVLAAMRKAPYGGHSCLIGEVVAENPGRVMLRTAFGATRVVDMLTGEQLPRIC